MRHYTSIEQSKKLLELGLNPESADMVYCYWENARTRESGIDNEPTVRVKLPIEKCDIPCWSLGALLEVMPQVIKDKQFPDETYTLRICKRSIRYDNNCAEIGHIRILKWENHDTLINCVCETVVWLLENNYIKKE